MPQLKKLLSGQILKLRILVSVDVLRLFKQTRTVFLQSHMSVCLVVLLL
jgi:hypothetical protein